MSNEHLPEPSDEAAEYLRRIAEGFGKSVEYGPDSTSHGSEPTYEFDPLASVRAACLDNVRAVHDRWRQMAGVETTAEGSTGSPEAEIGNIQNAGLLMYTLIQEAVAQGDSAALDRYVETITLIPGSDHSPLVAAYFAAAHAGNERAANSLHLQLAVEKTRASHMGIIADEPENITQSSTWSLSRTVEACRNAGEPPDEWIREYCIDSFHRAAMYARYLSDPHDQLAPDERLRVETLLAQEWAGTPDFQAFSHTAAYLQHIRDAALRDKIITRYYRLAQQWPEMETSNTALLQRMTEQVLWGPSTGVASIKEHLLEAARDVDPRRTREPLSEPSMQWKLDMLALDNADPEIMVRTLDMYTSAALQSGPGNSLPSLVRDQVLSTYARRFAIQGNFEASRIFLNAISNMDKREATTATCVKYATAPEQLALLQPDELTLAVNPELQIQSRIREAKRTNDLNELVAIGRELAEQHAATVAHPDYQNPTHQPTVESIQNYAHTIRRGMQTEEVLSAVLQQDTARGFGFGSELLRIIRNGPSGANAPIEERISDTLIKAGDPVEALFRLEVIRTEVWGSHLPDRLANHLLLYSLLHNRRIPDDLRMPILHQLRSGSGYPPTPY